MNNNLPMALQRGIGRALVQLEFARLAVSTRMTRSVSARVAGAMLALAMPLVPATPVMAAEASIPPSTMGCILREPGVPARFVPAGRLDKEAVKPLVSAAVQARPTRLIDPCLLGQRRSLPAAAYQRLAARQPQRFAPLAGALSEGSAAAPALRRAPQYHYVAVDEQIAPPVLFFDARAIGNATELAGTAFSESGGALVPQVATFDGGRLTPIADGLGGDINAGGTIGGAVLTDAENFLTQAALFRGGRTMPIPLQPGEIASDLIDLNDLGEALIVGFDEAFTGYLSLWDGVRSRPLDLGPEVPFALFVQLNNQGVISGTTFQGAFARGFRHDTRTGITTLLHPLHTEPEAWVLGINNRGDVLGYSFIPGATERIGVWDASGRFSTRFVEGTAEVPTISNWLEFNDQGLIVITQVTNPPAERNRSYLVPAPGVRVDLAEITADFVAEHGSLWLVGGINNAGNLFGLTLSDAGSLTFELVRRPR